MASADNIYLTVEGKSAHGAQPHQSADAIVAACAIVNALQTVVSRTVDPLEPAVVTIGTIAGGTSSNIIANEVKLSGTVRSFQPAVRDAVERRLEQIACTTAQAYGTTCRFEYRRCTPATINEAASTEIARKAVKTLFGDSALAHLKETTGGEDFAWFSERIPRDVMYSLAHAMRKQENAGPIIMNALMSTNRPWSTARPFWHRSAWMQV